MPSMMVSMDIFRAYALRCTESSERAAVLYQDIMCVVELPDEHLPDLSNRVCRDFKSSNFELSSDCLSVGTTEQYLIYVGENAVLII